MVFMTSSTDHVTGATGLTLTITASKDGGAFGSITPTVTERGSGWYNLALTTSHTDTDGDLALHITAAGADPSDLRFIVQDEPDPGDVFALAGPLGKTYGLMISENNAAQVLRVAQFQAGSTTQAVVLDASASAIDDFYNRATMTIVTGTYAGQNRLINDYVGSTKTAYLDRPLLGGAPSAADWFAIDSRGNTRSASDLAIGLATGGAAGYIDLQTDASAIDDFYNRMFVLIESGTGFGQARLITDYTGASRRAAVARNWTTAPDATSRYVVLPFGSVKVSELDDDTITAAAIAAGAITSSEAPALANLDAAVSTRGTADPGDEMNLANDAITAAKIAAGAITSSEAPALANLDAAVSTRAPEAGGNVAAIKAKTDNLPADPADESSIQATLATIAGYIDTEITDIQGRLPAALVGGKIDANLGSITAAVLTAAAFAAGAVDASALATDAVEEIALKVLTWASSNWEGSAAPKSLGTAVMKATHRLRDNAGTLEIYLSNGVTLHVSQTVTTDAALLPIDELTGAA